MPIDLSLTVPVTAPIVAQVPANYGWIQGSTVDGSSLSPASVKSTFTIRPGAAAVISAAAAASNVVTITTSAAHGFLAGQVVSIMSSIPALNGNFVIASVPTATTLTYSLSTPDAASAAAEGNAIVFADPGAALTFQTANALGVAVNIPSVATYEAAMYAMGADIVNWWTARQADVAAASAALATAQTALAAAQTAQQQAIAARTAALGTPAWTAANDAVTAAIAATAAAAAAAGTAQGNLATAQAAMADFANPPLVT